MNPFAKEPATWERILWPTGAVLLCLGCWYCLVAGTHSKVFPSPIEVEKGLAELLRKGLLWAYISDSLRRVFVGFGCAAISGIPIGLFLGWFPIANLIVNPVIQLLRPISPIAWIPVAIIVFGVGDRAATFLIFLGAFFPIVVASVNSVLNIPAVFRQVGRNFGLPTGELLRRVLLPAALPQIMFGLRVAFGIAWLVVVAAEMIAVNSGLGYLVIDSRNAGKRYDLVLAAICVIGLIGLVLDSLFRRLERLRVLSWGMR